ncbi:MAG: peptidoglycan-binding protein [Neomegalonema sp.]|nr:peptidoglycan-binding protein [Neomegalonema sp.]
MISTSRHPMLKMASPALLLAIAAMLIAAPPMAAMAQSTPLLGQLIDAPNLPADAKPRGCITRVFDPGATKREDISIEVEPARVEPVAFPEVARWVEREIVLKTAETRYEVVPAVFKKRIQKVLIEPERVEYRIAPAKFEEISEKMVIRAARAVWRPGPGEKQRRDPKTGELQHRVMLPAETAPVIRRKLLSPARVEKSVRPAVFREIETQVLIKPAQIKEIRTPAVTKRIRVLEIFRTSRVERRRLPARMAKIPRRAPSEAGRIEWRLSLCATELPPATVRDLQRALRRAGFDAGDVDGRLGPATKSALVAYQGVQPLSDRIFLIETLRRLGVQPQGR